MSQTTTASCFCGAVQLEVPTEGEGLVDTFVCHCTDCHKISSSMFCSNFVVKDTHVKHLKGESNLKTFSMRDTIWNHTEMTNFFCQTCGTLMYRRNPEDFPGLLIPRIGTLDDLSLMETKFKPRVEQYVKDRASWLKPVESAEITTEKMNMEWGMGKGKKEEATLG